MRRTLALLLLLLPGAARADGVGAALHDNRWTDALALVAASPDPVAANLVLYYRLLAPGAGHASEIAAFLAEKPTWPNAALLRRRLEEALAVEPDSRVVLDLCGRLQVQQVAALARCADAEGEIGSIPAAAQFAREAWIQGITDPAQEKAFLHQWGAGLTAADQWARFDRLAWSDNPSPGGPASRQIGRLDPSQRAVAEARLALRRDEKRGQVLAGAVAAAGLATDPATDPALMLELARSLRRTGSEEAAQALWLAEGATAERAVPAERRAAFWGERDLLARHRLRSGDAAGAYALADDAAGLAPEQAMEAHFLAGFIALRWLHDPAGAAGHFRALAGLGHAAITQARAQYWLGRSAEAAEDTAAAHAAYEAAAAWPTTFYGQLAARTLGEDDAQLAARIRALPDPAWTPERALTLEGREAARAAALLTAWGEGRRARAFLLQMDEAAEDGADHAVAARLAAGFGMADLAVAIARRAGRDGVILAQAGWPVAVTPPAGVEPALTLGLIRQESNFAPDAVSPTGARGLMQLMPATALAVANTLGDPAASRAALVSDPGTNMRLGTAYLAGLLNSFGGALPYAVAAYNAGPNRVTEWLAANGDPAKGPVTMLDWIELIPFAETRNYVQRVIENVVVYRAKAGIALPHPLARWLG